MVSLYRIAHARTGDKGNRANIGLWPYHGDAYPFLAEQVTADHVLRHFRHKGATACVRYDLAKLQGFNFVIDDVLEGGVNGALNLDGHGKTLAFHLLTLEVDVPEGLVMGLQGGDVLA